MAGSASVTVTETTAKHFSEWFAGRVPAEKFEESPGWFFDVVVEGERSGGFWVIPRPAGAELHTELKVRGALAVRAVRELFAILRDRYAVARLTTYSESRQVGMMAAACGFRRVAQSGKRVFWEKWLPTQDSKHR